jgi:hypothetical protein
LDKPEYLGWFSSKVFKNNNILQLVTILNNEARVLERVSFRFSAMACRYFSAFLANLEIIN